MNTIVRYRTQGLLLAALVFAIDVAVKYLVVFQLKLQHKEVIEVLPFFRLTWAPNYGVSLGMLTATSPEMRWLHKSLELNMRALDPWAATVQDKYGNLHLVNRGWLAMLRALLAPEFLAPPINSMLVGHSVYLSKKL